MITSVTQPVDNVISRLDRVRQTPQGWTARCPAHEDGAPSLTVSEGHDHRVLLFCFAGCNVEEITRALDLELSDLFVRNDDWRPEPRLRGKPHLQPSDVVPEDVVSGLLERARFPLEWEVAKLLAPLPPDLAQADLRGSRDYLKSRDVDIEFTWATATLIRGTALFSFCDRHHAGYEDVARAVHRLLRYVEAEERVGVPT